MRARVFSREGAQVLLAHHKLAMLEAVAMDIIAAGGAAEALNTLLSMSWRLDSTPTNSLRKPESVDVAFNVISIPHVQGKLWLNNGLTISL